jgi:hypothetical protein
VSVRAAVEANLARYTPDDDDDEIRDVVSGIVDEWRETEKARNEQEARRVAKREALACAPQVLALVVSAARARLGFDVLKRLRVTRTMLTHHLRRCFDRRLRGDESAEEILELATAWLDAKVAAELPASEGSRIAPIVASGVVVAGALGLAAYQTPAVRAQVSKGLAAAQQLLARLTSRPSPPQPPPPNTHA